MDKFRIYKIVLKPSHTVEGDWPTSEYTQIPDLSKAQDSLERIFENGVKQLPIGKDGLTGESPLPNRILAHHEKVTLIRLNNPKNVSLWKQQGTDYEKTIEESLPYSYIIIDNRIGIGQAAIEVKSDAWSDPETIKNLLVDNLNRMLNDLGTGICIEFRHKWLPSDFFDFVKQKKKEDGVIVKKLTYEFTNPKFETPIETAVDTSGHLRQLMNMLSELGGAKAKLQIDAPSKNELIKRKLKDIKQMVSLVASNGYRLNVEFSDKTKYECNEHLKADLDLNLKTIRDYEHGVKHALFEFEMFRWLDEARNKTKEYKEDETPRTKPARNNKQKIS